MPTVIAHHDVEDTDREEVFGAMSKATQHDGVLPETLVILVEA